MLTLLTLGGGSFFTLACGSISEDGGPEEESSGGSESSSGGSESSSGGEGQLGCCLAQPICGPDETEIASEAECPAGASCYENSACCSTIWCARPQVQCAAVPTCTGGSFEVAECPEDTLCTPQTLCGTTIVCQELGPQCDAYPSCPEGTVEVDECPQDVSCSTQSICGTTIQCTQSENPPSCGGGPTCPEGTREVSGCPSSGDCEIVSACSTTIYCLKEASGGACDPEDPNREYISKGVNSCVGIDFGCDAGLVLFNDECGCGCQQEATCPAYLNCMPGDEFLGDPGCSDSGYCPLSKRVY